jgi:hypothetical protein
VLLIGREFSLDFLFERVPFFFREEALPLTSPLNVAPSAKATPLTGGDEGGVVSKAPLGSVEGVLVCFFCDRLELRDALGVAGC